MPQSNSSQPQQFSENTSPSDMVNGKKASPTPTRREQEAARKQPLVPGNRKEANKNYKRQASLEREKMRAGMAAGDEKYLTARDRGPQRLFIRNYIDSRFNVGEYLLGVMFIVLAATFIPSQSVQESVLFVTWLYVLLSAVDSYIAGTRARSAARKKFGDHNLQKGLRWYAAMRALQMRWMRMPRPQVKRGERTFL